MKRKICLIFNAAPRYREAIYTAMNSEFDCHWYFGETKDDIKEMDVSKLTHVEYYKKVGNPNKLYWQKGMLSLLFNKQYDTYLYLYESRSLSAWLFTIMARYLFPKKKIYTWGHGAYGKESKLQVILEGWLHRQMTGIFTYGEYAKNIMVKRYHIPEERITPIHNSLDYDTQLSLRKSITPSGVYREHFGNNNPVIVFVGRLTEVKRLDQIVEAVAKLKEKGEIYNVALIGDGAKRKALEEQAVKLEVKDQIWFYGACYDEKVNAELIYNADLCVAPGNIGLTAMHVLMFGCPALSHNDFKWQMPEFEAIKPGVTGDFFEKDNIEDMANAISKWFNANKDNREKVRESCYIEIDTNWNPYYQIDVLRKVFKEK